MTYSGTIACADTLENKAIQLMEAGAETPFFFENEGSRLFAILHTPCYKKQTARSQQVKGIVFCHPFAEEKAISHRVIVNFARFLCKYEYHVLRFDYRGCGDSEGDFESATLTTRLSDIGKAIGLMRERMGGGKVDLFGLRLGATLACLVAEADARVQRLVLWEPILRVREYFDRFLRMQVVAENIREGMIGKTREHLLRSLKEGKSVDILSFLLSARCFDEFINVDISNELRSLRKPSLMVAFARQKSSRKDLQLLLKECERNKTPMEMLYVQKRPFWFDPNDAVRELSMWQGHGDLFQQTFDWLEATRQ